MSELYHLDLLKEDQIEEVNRLFGRSFQDDPLCVYILRNKKKEN